MEKILYIYGYGSNPQDSSTMKVVKDVVGEIGFNLVSIVYDQEDPDMGITMLDKYIKDKNIKYVIGHSLGGFITLCLESNVKKIVINPCLKPSIELPKVGNISEDTITMYKSLERWLRSGDETPWVNYLEDVMGLFGDHDELFRYHDEFKKVYPRAYYINSDHRPKKEAFIENIKTKIKEFFN
jgi:hypothetical protein